MTDEDDLSWRKVGRAKLDRPSSRPTLRKQPPPAAASRPISVAERVRIAQRLPQAVVKVLSYRRGRDAVARTAAYVIKKAGGDFVVEGDIAVAGDAARAALVRDWERDFTTRKNGRDVMHVEMSAPPGSDRDRLFAAARAFAAATFGPNHQYALAEHRDTEHPHCHLLVKLRGHDGCALDPRKRDLETWRRSFAEAARAEGLMLDASPRAVRGVARRGVSRAVLEARRRGKVVARQPHEPYVRAQAARHAEERDAFRIAALRLARTAEGAASVEERARLKAMAVELARFAHEFPALAQPAISRDASSVTQPARTAAQDTVLER